jgi:hypothetical protein
MPCANYIRVLQEADVSHLSINLRRSRRPVKEVLDELALDFIH